MYAMNYALNAAHRRHMEQAAMRQRQPRPCEDDKAVFSTIKRMVNRPWPQRDTNC